MPARRNLALTVQFDGWPFGTRPADVPFSAERAARLLERRSAPMPPGFLFPKPASDVAGAAPRLSSLAHYEYAKMPRR